MTATDLWDFGPPPLTAAPPPDPGPGTARQAAVSADDLAVITDTWSVVVAESLAPAIAASYVAAAESQAARLAAALPAELAEAFAQPLIDTTQASLLYAAEASNRLVAIGDQLWANARISLVEGMAAGEDIPKLAARVRAATNVTLPRATVIARTETIGARNAGSYDEMVASGVVTHKRWLATNDNRTRPAHRLAGGLVPGVPAQEVPIDGKFSLGGWPCDHPGDPALPPEQGINCRCTLIYEVGDDETVSQVVDSLPTTAALWAFHMPGGHDQSKHGRGAQLDSLPRGAPMSASAAAHGTNPRYGETGGMDAPTYRDKGRAGEHWTASDGPPPSGAFEENCTNTTLAFEMRSRGYQVQAAPLDVLDRHGYAAGRTYKEHDDLMADAWSLPNGKPHGRSFSGQRWKSFAEVDAEVKGWPEGGRGVMTVGKHVFSVVKVKGKAQYVEPQFDASPSRIVTSQYQKKYKAGLVFRGESPTEAKVIRLDDLVPTGGIFAAITVA